MNPYRFRILNVFTVGGARLSGNPLCVFEDARGLNDAQMQALARQFNLSETTFILPTGADGASAHVRIFTPAHEMPFAGHPTLGTAHVVRELRGAGDRVLLEMKAGVIEVTAQGDNWTLRAASAPKTRKPSSNEDLARMLRLPESAIGGEPLWVDTGAEQLVIPLTSVEHVRGTRPDAEQMQRHAFSSVRGATMAYVWARGDGDEVTARFFFLANGSIVEDPATGSACANLGGWFLATRAALPVSLRVHQGEAAGRPSLLRLSVDAERRIFVSGEVIELARGTLALD